MSPWGCTQYLGRMCSGLNACLPWPSLLVLTWLAERGTQGTWALDSAQAAIREWEFLSWGLLSVATWPAWRSPTLAMSLSHLSL